MLISLHTSATKTMLGVYNAPAVPQSGEHICLNGTATYRVMSVCYQVQSDAQECQRVDVEVMPIDDAARQYITEAMYAAA